MIGGFECSIWPKIIQAINMILQGWMVVGSTMGQETKGIVDHSWKPLLTVSTAVMRRGCVLSSERELRI